MYQQSISSAFLIKTSFFYSGWKIFIANRLPNQHFLDNEEDILRATQHAGQIGSLLEFQVNSWSSKLVPKYCENLSTLVLDITDDVLTGQHATSFPSLLPGEHFDHKKRYVRAQSYANAIWSRWYREYVPSLNKRVKWHTHSDFILKTGDPV